MVNVEQQQRVAMLKYLNSFPPGYRFCPTDKELVLDYLKNKVMNKPLPPNKIMDINLYNHGPQDLSGLRFFHYRVIFFSFFNALVRRGSSIISILRRIICLNS